MTWVLIIYITSNIGLPITPVTAEFNTQQACNDAISSMKLKERYFQVGGICTPKG